jgi:uncharacterized protein DUF5678
MSRPTLEEVLAGIDSLSPQDRRQVRRALKEDSSKPATTTPVHEARDGFTVRDMIREAAWLEQHREEYAGQWVALDGDRLIAASTNAKDALAAAQAAGLADALIVRVETITSFVSLWLDDVCATVPAQRG